MNETTPLGSIQIHSAVLRSVAILTAFDVPGVVAVGKLSSKDRSNWVFPFDGVRVQNKEGRVVIDMDLTVIETANLVDLGRRVQQQILASMASIAGAGDTEVNVKIQSVAA